MKIDFSDVASGFEAIPSGHYLVRITDGELRTAGDEAKNPGSEYVFWTCTVQTGEFEGRKVFTNTSLLPNALFGLKGLLAATGKWSKAELDSEAFEFDIEPVIGEQVIAVVTVRQYQGEDQNSIRKFRPATPEAMEALSSGAVADAGLMP